VSKKESPSTPVVNIVVPVTAVHGMSEDQAREYVANLIELGEQATVGRGSREYWEEDPDYPADDWRYAASNGDTRRGYWEWVAAEKAQAALDAELPEPRGPVDVGAVAVIGAGPRVIVLADSGSWVSDSPVVVEVFQEENFRMNFDESPEDTLGVSLSVRDMALGNGIPFGQADEYIAEMMEILKEGPMPCRNYGFWDLADENGWTLAHQAAKYRCLPENFGQWILADENGWTVAHEAAYQGEVFSKNFKGLDWSDNNGVTVREVANEFPSKSKLKMGM
jgi:hypothetical protein